MRTPRTVKVLLPQPEVEACVRHMERLSGRTRASFEDYRPRSLNSIARAECLVMRTSGPPRAA